MNRKSTGGRQVQSADDNIVDDKSATVIAEMEKSTNMDTDSIYAIEYFQMDSKETFKFKYILPTLMNCHFREL